MANTKVGNRKHHHLKSTSRKDRRRQEREEIERLNSALQDADKMVRLLLYSFIIDFHIDFVAGRPWN